MVECFSFGRQLLVCRIGADDEFLRVTQRGVNKVVDGDFDFRLVRQGVGVNHNVQPEVIANQRIEAIRIELQQKQNKPANRILAVTLASTIALALVLCFAYPKENQTVSNPPAVSADQARRIEALAKLNQIEVHCPSFFDAPLGNKPCPAQEELDHVKQLVQQSIDAN